MQLELSAGGARFSAPQQRIGRSISWFLWPLVCL
jgi:hypothetical protein